MNRPENNEDLVSLVTESFHFGDVVVTNLKPEYRLLTVQVLMGFMWLVQHCDRGRMVLKVDDDTYVHLGKMEDIMRLRDSQKPRTVNSSIVLILHAMLVKR